MDGGERLLPWTRCRLWIVGHAMAGAALGVAGLYFWLAGRWADINPAHTAVLLVLSLAWALTYVPLAGMPKRLRRNEPTPVPRFGLPFLGIVVLGELLACLSLFIPWDWPGGHWLFNLAVHFGSLITGVLASAAFLALRVPFRKRMLAVLLPLQGGGFYVHFILFVEAIAGV